MKRILFVVLIMTFSLATFATGKIHTPIPKIKIENAIDVKKETFKVPQNATIVEQKTRKDDGCRYYLIIFRDGSGLLIRICD